VVAHILRLKLTLFVNSFRRSFWQVVGLAFGILYGVASAVFVVAGLVSLRFVEVDVARATVIVVGSVVVIVVTVLPLILGTEDALDPRKLGLFGINTTKLAVVLIIGAVVSVPAVVITVISLAQLVTWSRDGVSEVLAILSVVLIVATCLLSSRVSTSLASFLISTRRARDLTAIFSILALLALSPVIVVVMTIDWRHRGLELLGDAANILGWTPLGAAWAIPADAAAGNIDDALAKLAIAAGWVVILAIVWRVLVGAMLTTPLRQPHVRTYAGLGWFDWFARTPTGAIAARSMTYWFRDSRYGSSLLAIPFIPLVMVIVLSVAGLQLNELALLPLPVICLFLGWFVHNDVAFDNTAIWLHLSTSTRGRADRWGRIIPVLVLGVPLIAIGSLVSAWLYGDWIVLFSLVGVSSSLLLAGLGVSSVASARFPYSTVRPGDSPFSQPQGVGSPAGGIQAFTFIFVIVFASPAIAAAALGFIYGSFWHLLSLAIGVGLGLLVLTAGTAIGARFYDRRTSELLVFASQN